MANWEMGELLRSTQYGKVYIITKINNYVHARRIRRVKDTKLKITNEKHVFTLSDSDLAKVGTFMFIEKGGKHAQLLNSVDPTLSSEVAKAIAGLGGKA